MRASLLGVVWMCPEGHQNSMKGFHTIRDAGAVEPRVHCHEDECGFARYVRLASWKPESTPS